MPNEKATVRWSDNSKEAKKLVSLFVDGTYGPTSMPKEIYYNHPDLFGDYKEEQLHNAVRRIKTKFGWVIKTLKVDNIEKGKYYVYLIFFYLVANGLLLSSLFFVLLSC
jgi:hypothetical protein